MGNAIFALDIGTRSVTGMIVKKNNDAFEMIDYYTKEHDERSMRDGQIHDVIAVAQIIRTVKETLEKRIGYSLHKVCVAAAGRALKTIEATAAMDLQTHPIYTAEDVKHLELSALQAAQEKLTNEHQLDSYSNYYCVGYSLLYYKLDNERIGSLIEQKGNEASADIIATFLPKIVVESLLTAITKAGLEMEAMTLEPIAALHVLIPESMRRLNVVLIDIGAGTSDIAITDKGTVVSYGMVPVAGDEITEAVSDQYLLDFPEAERVKRQIVKEGRAEIEDILGFMTEVSYEELIENIKKPVDSLTEVIANEILQLNMKAPRAVMLVGGGSLTPQITEILAAKLGLPHNRVAVRGSEVISQITKTENLPAGPMFVTPVGIAIAAKERPVQYVSVQVNGQALRLFEMNRLTVGDSLVQAGYELSRLYGRPGIAKILTVNGQEVTIPGEFGGAPEIFLNERKTTVNQPIQNGDCIRIEKGNDGDPAHITLAELIDDTVQMEVYFEEQAYQMGNTYTVNAHTVSKDYIVQDKDTIQWRRLEKIADFFDHYFPGRQLTKDYPVIVNHKQMNLICANTVILLNGRAVSPNDRLHHKDQLRLIPADKPTVSDLFTELDRPYWHSIPITFNDEKVTLKQPAYLIQRKEAILDFQSLLEKNEQIKITEKKPAPFIFQDVFREVAIDLTHASGKFHIFCNDKKASFDTIIHSEDKLAIIWDK